MERAGGFPVEAVLFTSGFEGREKVFERAAASDGGRKSLCELTLLPA